MMGNDQLTANMIRKGWGFTMALSTMKNLPIFVLLLIILGLSVYNTVELNSLKSQDTSSSSIESLKEELQEKEALQQYQDQFPRITYLTEDVVAQAKENNLAFFNNAKTGDYLLEYLQANVLYRPSTEEIINIAEAEKVPSDLLDKVVENPELAGYKGVQPLLVIKVNEQNLEDLKAQIQGIDESFIGDYIINYQDRIVIYDYEESTVKSIIPVEQPSQQQAQLPQDFNEKLMAHEELQGYEEEQPSGMLLDQESLEQLKQQYPTLYEDAEAGDVVLQYSDKLIIYNYQDDEIKNSFDLQ